MSRTETAPSVTVVRVPAQVSVVTHLVPRTVATLLRPCVRKRPRLSEPQSLRRFVVTAAARPPPLREPHCGAGPRRSMSVTPPAVALWRTRKTPPWNRAVWGLPPGSAVVSATSPARVSTTAPDGTVAPAPRTTKPLAPGARTLLVPDTGATPTVWPSAGTAAGCAAAGAAAGAGGRATAAGGAAGRGGAGGGGGA